MNEADNVAQWLRFARLDLENAQFLYDHRHPRPLEIICYHCQQAVEKVLKAYLVAKDIEIQKTHDLGVLCEQCAILDVAFGDIAADCGKLTLFVIYARYPSPIEIVEQDTDLALTTATSVFTFAVERITLLQEDLP